MPTNPDPDLMRIFDFTAADLEANRAGKMSEHQYQRLQDIAENERFAGQGLAIILALLLFGLICYTVQNLSDPARIIFPAIISIVVVIFFVLSIIWAPVIEQDLKIGQIKIVEGNFTLKTKLRGKTTDYIMDFGAIKLFIDDRKFAQLRSAAHKKDRCHVYYLPKSCLVLSTEVIIQ
jgi:hypothetical protein